MYPFLSCVCPNLFYFFPLEDICCATNECAEDDNLWREGVHKLSYESMSSFAVLVYAYYHENTIKSMLVAHIFA